MPTQTLLLVDGHALVHRAYHAIPPLNTRAGLTTHAVFGFTTMLLKAIEDLQPDYIAVAFDRPTPTFRHVEYKDYKAQRPSAPDDLRSQFALVRRVVQAFRIPIFEVDGFEADDVLGTLARQATRQGVDTVIVTGDLDTLQLVDNHVRVYTTKGHFSETITYDAPAVRARYALEPNQLADLRGLKGDPSDNIPGVKGIGEKTAVQLLQQFGSVAGVYAHLDEVKPALREKLATQKDQALQSARLATIVTDVPIILDLAACRVQDYDRDAVLELFRELEFRSLVNRLPGASPSQREPVRASRGAGGRDGFPTQMSLFGEETPVDTGKPSPAFALAPAKSDTAQAVTIVTTEDALIALAQRLSAAGSFGVDVETTATNAMTADLVGIALAPTPAEAYYVPIGHPVPPAQLSLDVVRRHLGPVLANPAISKVAHNAKYDVTVLTRHGMPVAGVAYDTMIAAYLLCEKGLGLKDLAFTRLGVEMTPITDLIGKGKSQITMAQVPVESVAPYAGADVANTLRLQELFTPLLREEGSWDLFHDVEMPLVHVLTVMEMNGVLLDTARLAAFSRELGEQIAALEDRIYAAAGTRFNIGSTQQLGQVLFERLKLPGGKRTKTGYSTDAEVLESLRDKHEIVSYLLEYRQLTKLKSTYVDALPALVNPHTGRVHTSFNQTVATTGRLSSSDPNLQNIPARTELGRQVRAAFIAPPGRVLLSADYSQVELRIVAHISGDKALQAAFARGEDIHASTAAAIFDVPLNQVTPDQRRLAKCVAADTLIHTTAGVREIADLGPRPATGEFTPLENMSVVTDTGLRQATHLYFDGRQPVREITVERGLSITCTHRHRLRVIDESGNYTWKEAGAIVCGDYLAVVKGKRVFGDQNQLPPVDFPADLQTTNHRDIDLPQQWTPELARFLGYLVSEGYVYRHKRKPYTGGVRLAQSLTHQAIIDDLAGVVTRLFGQRAKVKPRRQYLFVFINSSKLSHWLRILGFEGTAGHKAIPAFLLTAPYDIQVNFLRALFAGDGSLKTGQPQITYSTKSKQLAVQLQQMLLNFGYLFSLQAERRQGREGHYYQLTLTGAKEVNQFLSEIGFVGGPTEVTPTRFSQDLSTIPHQTERLRQLYPFLKGKTRDKAYEILRAKHPVRLNQSRADLIVSYLQAKGIKHPALTALQELLDLKLTFLPVVAIEEKEAETYDLSVPGGNTYLANGFVSHNTINFGIIYGMGEYGLAQRIGVTPDEAAQYIAEYLGEYPRVQDYLAQTRRQAREQGYVSTLLGRRRYVPELKSANKSLQGAGERMAVNHPIQGTAADIIKVAMVRLQREIEARRLRSLLTLQVHDELVLEVPREELDAVAPLVVDIMEHAYEMIPPLKVDVKVGENWEEMTPLETGGCGDAGTQG